MNLFIVVAVSVLLVAFLALLGVWQRKIEDLQNERARRDIRTARDRGTDKAIAQHPQIDAQACIGCGTCISACPESDVIGLVDGVAHIIHGARCIGHGLCAEACPVAAITVGLGDVSGRTDIPILSESFETSVPGVYIAGELGGLALIRTATEQGRGVVRAVAEDLRSSPPVEADVDLLIVGAGPAGLAATMQAVESKLSYLTIDQDDIGGTVRKYPRRKLTLTGRMELPLYGRVTRQEFLKEELIEFWESLIERYGLDIRSGIRLTGLAPMAGAMSTGFTVETSAGRVRARRVILALGRRGTPRKLGVPGEASERVLYQLMDAASYQHQRLLVVGGGDSAIEAATGLANQLGNVVTLSYRKSNFFRLKARNEERIEEYQRDGRVEVLFNSHVEAISEGSVRLRLGNESRSQHIDVPADWTFVFAGGEPPYAFLRELGVRFNGDEGSETPASPALEVVQES